MNNPDQLDVEPTDEVRALTAELMARIAVDADGRSFDDSDPATWAEADAVEPEFISRGAVRFKIVDPDATDLALAAGAIDADSPPAFCMRVQFDLAEDAPQPGTGQFIVLTTTEDVKVVFFLWLTHADLHSADGPDLGPNAMHDARLDALEPGQGLLVQVFDGNDDPESA